MPNINTELDFEFYGEGLATPDLEQELWAQAWERVQEFAGGRDDMIGASAAVERIEGRETPHLYKARIVAYVKPKNIVVNKKAEQPTAALQQALDTLERRLRKHREKRREPWKKPKKP